MIVMGIDPGFSFTGYGILKKEGNKIFLLDSGVLKMDPKKSLAERIGIFHDFFCSKIDSWQVNLISIETPFLGKNPQNFLKLGYLRGIIYLLINKYKLGIFEFSPAEIKLSLTGTGFAQKEQVAYMILRLFPGLQLPNKLDLTDALAVAVCGVWKQNSVYNLR